MNGGREVSKAWQGERSHARVDVSVITKLVRTKSKSKGGMK